MNDTDEVTMLLRDLPPDLREPADRFEQVGERVRRRRRRHTAIAVGGAVAAVALAVPVAAQLLPETAEITPGGSETSAASEVAGPDVGFGGTRVTHLSDPVTITGTGAMTVHLGERPEGASGVGMVLDCLSAGEFIYPDGAGMICDSADAGTELTRAEDFESLAYVVGLARGAEEVEIRATEGASWRLTASYVSTELTEWGVNAKGETYGVENVNGTPDLLAVVAINGRQGYAYVSEMNAAWGQPTSPEHALELQEQRSGQAVSVPVYESDGETVIGEFLIGGGGDPADLGGGPAPSTATATWGP
ncbi:WS/DGAT domain-containing protein [Ornithinimicrobium sp. F0845]|uniref:WS/DGAT domain-containing protein n=1 Tax=Ornithinimicrobium sp. F0845 TaxID=2926412 RepID=UPI001FF35B03|nr:WS/DGAT domain-containing protein [Ornithinimicrobium sp. F0845]MCK0112636.1 WS/DGAT domain-containing protein [Ornithinimicrobium sp. F0845]